MFSERLREIAEKTVRYAEKQRVDQAQASAFMSDTALTRFANSQIHQNVAEKSGGVIIKVVLASRSAQSGLTRLRMRRYRKLCSKLSKLPKPVHRTRSSRAFQSRRLGIR